MLAEKQNYFYSAEADMYAEFRKEKQDMYNTIMLYGRGKMFEGKRIFPSWGLIGTATSVGWEGPDIALVEEVTKPGIWLLKGVKLTNGLVLFRFNNDWGVHYGDNNRNDKILDFLGEDIPVAAGTYNIVLDLSDKNRPRYRME
jgi:hypothetical protein